MKDEDLRNIWNSLDDYPGVPITGKFSAEQFIKSRSATVKNKIRKILHNDLLIKLAGGIFLLLDIAFYFDVPKVLYVCAGTLIFLLIMTALEFMTLKQFNSISNPEQSMSNNLSGTMIFLQRKSNILGILSASSQVLIFVPGLLLYYFLIYGQLRPMTGMSFFVFFTLCLIGTITSYSRTISQIKHHVKHFTIYLSDLNDNVLQMAYFTIEKDRKRDNTIKTLIGMLLIFAFVVLIAVLKSIMG